MIQCTTGDGVATAYPATGLSAHLGFQSEDWEDGLESLHLRRQRDHAGAVRLHIMDAVAAGAAADSSRPRRHGPWSPWLGFMPNPRLRAPRTASPTRPLNPLAPCAQMSWVMAQFDGGRERNWRTSRYTATTESPIVTTIGLGVLVDDFTDMRDQIRLQW